MVDTDKLNNAINILGESAEHIAVLGQLSKGLSDSQIQISSGLEKMSSGLNQIMSTNEELASKINSVKDTEQLIKEDTLLMRKAF